MRFPVPEVVIIAEYRVEQNHVCHLLPGLNLRCGRSLPVTTRGLRPRAVIIVAPSCESEFSEMAINKTLERGLTDVAVLVTRFRPTNARVVVKRWMGEVVWLDMIEQELPRLVHKLLAKSLPRRVRDTLLAFSPSLDPLLRDVILSAFSMSVAPTNLHGLLCECECTERALRDSWKTAGFPGRVEALVDWVLLSRTTELHTAGVSLNRSCVELGVDVRRVQRASQRRTGEGAGTLDEDLILDFLTAWMKAG